jgi:hypothetical protein
MKQSKKELMNRYHVNTRPIILVLIALGFISVILAATIISSAKKLQEQNASSGVNPQTGDATITQTAVGGMILAVVENIDIDNHKITLFDVDRRDPLVFSYTGGTDITDKYGQVISINQIDAGIMVDASYDPSDYKLTHMNISTVAWEYPDVNNMTVDKTGHVMKIASSKYKYTDDVFVVDGNESATVDNVAEQDVLTVWGNEETICSIIVTTGHGTVKLEDYGDYLGDTISIGYESMLQVTDDFAVGVREGTFNLTVENGKYSATKSITVLRNQINYVSLGDLGPVGVKKCDVTFHITPFGADLYIDGELTSYSDPIELSYGNHSLKASLGGYTTYEGTVDIDSKGKVVKIDLPEATSDSGVQVTETDTGESDESSGDTSDSSSGDSATGGSSDDIQYTAEDPDFTLDESDSLDADHKIYIKTPSDASVYMDGDYIGTAPCKFNKIIGNHVLTFIEDGYKTMSYTVEVSDDGLDAYFTFPPLTESD